MKNPKLQTAFDVPEASPGFLLWKVNNSWQHKQQKALTFHGLTHVQFVLLASLVWLANKYSPTQKQLARHAGVDVMMTSQVVRVLEKKGLVSRTKNPDDQRAIALRPTDDGVRLANQAIKTVERVDTKFFESLGKNKTSFVKLMKRLSE